MSGYNKFGVLLDAISEPSEEDKALYPAGTLAARTKLVFVNREGAEATLFLENKVIDRLGFFYIAEHAQMEYSRVLNLWFAKISENEYYNNPILNPPITICVKYIEDKLGENTEVWQNICTGNYYLRTLCNEPFARWMTCGPRRTGWQDRAEVRPNVTFKHGEQIERVYYDDWNGTAAYSDTFNHNFRSG